MASVRSIAVRRGGALARLGAAAAKIQQSLNLPAHDLTGGGRANFPPELRQAMQLEAMAGFLEQVAEKVMALPVGAVYNAPAAVRAETETPPETEPEPVPEPPAVLDRKPEPTAELEEPAEPELVRELREGLAANFPPLSGDELRKEFRGIAAHAKGIEEARARSESSQEPAVPKRESKPSRRKK